MGWLETRFVTKEYLVHIEVQKKFENRRNEKALHNPFGKGLILGGV